VVVTWQPTAKGLAQGVLIVQHSGLSGMVQAGVKGIYQPPPADVVAKESGGKVDIAPESIDFGTSAGGIPIVRSVTVTNHLTEAIKIQGVTLSVPDQSGFTYKSQCPETLAPEGICSVIVTWQPTAKGLAQGVLAVQHSGRGGLVQSDLKGSFQPPPAEEAAKETEGKIQATPESLDFGSSPGGISAVRSIILTNNSGKDVDIKGVVLNVPEQSGFSDKSECPSTLAAGKACNIVVTWVPTAKGVAQGVLVVQHTGKSGMTQVDIKGSLQPELGKSAAIYPEIVPDRGLLVSDREKIEFGSNIKEESAITTTLVNAGNSALTLKSLSLSGVEDDVDLSDAGCAPETVLKPGEACPLTISWLPTHPGAILDSLQIMHTGARGVLVIPVGGSADASVGKDTEAMASGSLVKGESANRGGAVGVPAADGGRVAIASGASQGSAQGARLMKMMFSDYTVTSHSTTRAVIDGPKGGLVVRDGEAVIIEGIQCMVSIVPAGVILSSEGDKVMLPFDRSLRLLNQATSAGAPASAPAAAPAPASASAGGAALLPPNLTAPPIVH
jgi:hypothetical protein